jgi:hypothetical protein
MTNTILTHTNFYYYRNLQGSHFGFLDVILWFLWHFLSIFWHILWLFFLENKYINRAFIHLRRTNNENQCKRLIAGLNLIFLTNFMIFWWIRVDFMTDLNWFYDFSWQISLFNGILWFYDVFWQIFLFYDFMTRRRPTPRIIERSKPGNF